MCNLQLSSEITRSALARMKVVACPQARAHMMQLCLLQLWPLVGPATSAVMKRSVLIPNWSSKPSVQFVKLNYEQQRDKILEMFVGPDCSPPSHLRLRRPREGS